MNPKDTIVAISTPVGEGAIGVVRLSGRDALSMAKGVFSPRSLRARHTPQRLYYGTMKDPQGNTIDDGYMVYMKAPRSFTGEDVVELYAHGSMVVLEEIVQALVSLGARPAEPGEFTKRAFINGKLDLLQAEAVIDLIRAKTERAAQSARGRLEGRLSSKIEEIKDTLMELAAACEAELDFAEEEIETLPTEELLKRVSSVEREVGALLATFREGHALKEGVSVVILGRPNVGKSTLLNILLKEERAIVTPQPGTTRDFIEEVVSMRGLPIRLVDTAGLRRAEDPVEAMGIDRAKRRAERAELTLFVTDASMEGGLGEDLSVLLALKEELRDKGFIVVANKMDLVEDRDDVAREIGELFNGFRVVFISAAREEGIEGLEEAIYEEVCAEREGAEPLELIVSVRHRDALRRCLEGLERARGCAERGEPREILCVELRWALERLGELTGQTATEDILDRIFSTFCIGK